MTRSLFLLTLLTVFVLAGCVRTPGGVASSTMPLTPGGYTEVGATSASDCKIDLLGILPVSGGNQTHNAIEKAKKKRNADALINVTIERIDRYYILWSSVCTEVFATAVRVP